MDTLQSMWVFRRVVELGSFTKAADFMDISTAMASKHVHHLEKTVQAKLLNRTSRHISLTESGEAYYLRCVHALDTLQEASKVAEQSTLNLSGLLKITAPAWMVTSEFVRVLTRYREQYPDVTLSIHLDSRHTDLVAEGIDVALRVTSHPEPNLIVRPLTRIEFHWVASPEYLEKHGYPQMDNLPQHLGLLPVYAHVDVPLKPVVSSNNALMLYQMARMGAGMAYLPDCLIQDDLASGRLKVVLSDLSVNNTHTLYAAYMNREFLSAKLRSFIDFLAQNLGKEEGKASSFQGDKK